MNPLELIIRAQVGSLDPLAVAAWLEQRGWKRSAGWWQPPGGLAAPTEEELDALEYLAGASIALGCRRAGD